MIVAAPLLVSAVSPTNFAVPEIQGPQPNTDPDLLDDEVQGPQEDPSLELPVHDGLRVLADRVVFDKDRQVVDILGHVEVHSPPFIVFADKVQVDFSRRQIRSIGRVRVVEDNRLIVCEKAMVRMKSGVGTLDRVRFEIRDQPVPLAQVRELEAMGRSWPGALWLFGHARRIDRAASGALILRDAEVTPCDCGSDPPSWKMRAARVDIITEHGAWARWPVLQVGEVPVLILPAWYVPLSGRQSGLLAPRLELRDGFWFRQPLYLTLGRSADMTLTPGFVLRRGPRLEGEMRWAPAQGNQGSLRLTGQWDEKFLAAQALSRPSLWTGISAQGEQLPATRGSLRLFHSSKFGRQGLMGPGSAVIDLRLSSDRLVASDFGNSLGARIEPYLRSAAQLGAGFGQDFYLGAQAAGYQDLRQQKLLFFPDPGLTPYRAPMLEARLLPLGLGPLVLKAESDLLRNGLWGSGLASPLELDVSQESWRLATMAGLDWPLRLGPYLQAGAGLAYRHAWYFSEAGKLRWAGQSFVRGRLSTTLRRSWRVDSGKDEAHARVWQHRVQPFVRYVAQPWGINDGAGATPILDERDRMARGLGGGQQLLLGVGQSLRLRQGNRALEVLSLTLAQGFDLDAVGAQSWAALDPDSQVDVTRQSILANTLLSSDLKYRALSGRLLLAMRPQDLQLATMLSRISVAFSKQFAMSLSYDYLGEQPADMLYATTYELFGDDAIPVPEVAVADRLATSLAYSPWDNVKLRYGVELALVAGRDGNLLRRVLAHGGSMTYRSACKCWEAGLRLRFWPDRDMPDVGFVLTVNGFGEQISVF